MVRQRIQPYRAGSRSARELSEASGVQRVRLVRTRFRPRPGDRIVNWGSTNLLFPDEFYLNHPARVAVASDKLRAYTALAAGDVVVPPFTTDGRKAEEWLQEGAVVLARTMLRASGGRGIIVLEPAEMLSEELPEAPLYVKYVPKYDEYRVHVFRGELLDVQQKRRRNNEQSDSRIRNAGNGWVFCRQEVNAPAVVIEQAKLAVEALRLDFGAVDIGYTRRSRQATVYEVNTAPGIEGTTLEHYASAIRMG